MDPIIATIVTLVGGGLFGSILTATVTYYRGKIQTMECHYLEDDILSKIPQVNEENEIVQQNLHFKRFKVINTTNKDIKEFKIIFQFDNLSIIKECYSRSKEGYNKQKIIKSSDYTNEAEATVKNFNRGDEIEFNFQIANLDENKYYVTESNCIGFKIKCYDKRIDAKHSLSPQSSTVLVAKDKSIL